MKKNEDIQEKIIVQDIFNHYSKKADLGVRIFLTPNEVKKLIKQ